MRTFYKSVRQCLGDTAAPRPQDHRTRAPSHGSQEEEEDTAAPTAVTDVTTMSSLVQATRSHALAQLCHAAAQVGVVRCAVRHLPRVTTGACDTLRTYSAVTVPCAPCSNSLSQIVFLRCPLRCLLTCASAWARLIEVFGRVCHNPG